MTESSLYSMIKRISNYEGTLGLSIQPKPHVESRLDGDGGWDGDAHGPHGLYRSLLR